MTVLHPGLRSRSRVSVLGDTARGAVQALVDADPIVNAVVSARLRAAGSLRARALGGTMIGVREGRELRAACFHGGNLIPIGGDQPAWELLAAELCRRPRLCTSVVGPADAVTTLWAGLARRWGPAREVRARQPLLVLDRRPAGPVDHAVRPVRRPDRDRYFAAASAMFAEELGISPAASPGAAAFGDRVDELIASGRAFASFDFRGQVVFKADLGAVTSRTCQVQGVWVRPDLRGRGIGTAALAAVFAHALRLAPTVSLYVNDYNHPARRVYEKLGMRQYATLATVLV